MTRLRIGSASAAVAVVVAASAALRFAGALAIPGPWIAPDEMVYGLLGQSLYREGRLEILDGPTPFVSLVYPALVGLPLALEDLELGYRVAQALQAVVMSAAAVPVFLWGRELMAERWALLAATLSVALPGLAYSGLLMTEVAFYPIAVLALWALARALADPTPARQALLVAAVAAATATRLQAAVLVPTLVAAAALKCGLDRSPAAARRLLPTLGGLVALAGAWAAWHLRGGDWTRVLGVYRAAGESRYELADAVFWISQHAGDAVLMTGFLPACAFALLLVERRRGRVSGGVDAYLVVTTAYALCLVVLVGVFASRHVLRLAERDLLTLAPLLFLGFALWLSRGAPRPRLATGVVVFAAAAAVVTIRERYLWQDEAVPDSFTLAALHELTSGPREVDVPVFVALVALVGAVLIALVPRRLVLPLPAVLLVALAAASVLATQRVAERARALDAQLVGDDPRWIDAAAPGPAAYMYDGDPYWNAVWAHAFWNRRVARVLDLPRARVPGPLPQVPLTRRPDGRLLPRRAVEPVDYAVTGANVRLVGEPVASAAQEGTGQGALVLWRIERPLRISYTTNGVLPNGDMYGPARLTVYGCGRGSFGLTLIAKASRRVEIRRNDEVYAVVRFRADEDTWAGDVPTPPSADTTGICTFEVRGDNFLGSTRFEFSRG